jgi:hypothetical protein
MYTKNDIVDLGSALVKDKSASAVDKGNINTCLQVVQ